MKKWLSIIGAIGLTATSTTSLISCQKPNNNENGKGDNKPKPSYNPQQPPKDSNWKLIPRVNDVLVPPKIIASTDKNKYVKEDDRKYIVIYPYLIQQWNIIKKDAKYINNTAAWSSKAIIYYWDGDGEPETPTIDKNTGEITDWKEQKGTE
ncbi:lipoprotein [Spiroplasma phoeniceum]|uniref:Spiroplasma plectrovirus-related protein n=1 Tax=Spiroplasma phoeniceum P40 TaxID=1276259 RepID=A0A345DNI4_9MOLU|nr:lipoprotein [Spiroplasma phoeniceum]AXF95772.1 spiroplasma plectrovirus-related protein [Spiroplasma phoeniceum P40]AXF96362.1 spiroplasma plectrovirus-related protein [Spiroplasma phoeniceum P40]